MPIDVQVNASLTAIVVLSTAPLFDLLQHRLTSAVKVLLDGVGSVGGQTGSVLVIVFGRFGQVASQWRCGYQIRGSFESTVAFGQIALVELE